MMNREAVIELLKQQNVSHEVIDHPAAYTIADMESFGLPRIDQIAKNPVWLAPEDLLNIVTAHGNEISVITL